MVNQDLKQLSLKFQARIDTQAFTELFKSRLEGNKVIIPRGLEYYFIHRSETSAEKSIQKLIFEYREQQDALDEENLFKQKRRLVEAKKVLQERTTKKALEDERIATNKIEWLKNRVKTRNSPQLIDRDFRIYPLHIAPVIRQRKDERIIEPRRYLLRPHGQPETFDQKYHGCYNAREDNLTRVAFWKPLFGKKHALLIITEFYENVSEHAYQKRPLKSSEEERNLILRFKPKGVNEIFVPCIFDDWKKPGEWDLHSFALITTDPPPEIAETGHNRCPIFLKPDAIESWLNPQGKSSQELHELLHQRETPFYEHQLAA